MDQNVLDRLIADAVARANAYLEKNKAVLLAAIPDEAERAEVQAILDQGYDGNKKLTAAVAAIITHFVDGKNPNKSDDGRHVTYVAGANPSKQLLLEAVHAGGTDNPAINALRATLQTGVQFDFQEAKKKFTELTGENLDGHNYAKFRGLFSGMDQVIAAYAKNHNLDMIRDNTLAISDPAARERVINGMQAEGGKLRMVAIALTPEEAETQAPRFGIGAKEAATNAERFAAFFPEMIEKLPNMDITLLDKDLKPIFVRINGNVIVNDEVAMAYWSCSSVNPPTADHPPGQQAVAGKACSAPTR